jgi:hypothetical protein
LKGLVSTAQAIENLDAEKHLGSAVWQELSDELATLSDASKKDAEALQMAATKVFLKHVLEGPEVHHDSARRYGNAMRRERLEELLQLEMALPPASVKVLLRGNFDHARFVSDLSGVLDTSLYPYVPMWATFNERAPHDDPFGDIGPRTTARINACLGLKPYNKEMLLISYRLNGSIRARKPTVADAYPYSDWNVSFRPEPVREVGYTVPRNTAGLVPAFEKPEVVHQPIRWGDVDLATWSVP